MFMVEADGPRPVAYHKASSTSLLVLAIRDKIIDNARTRSLISRLCGEHLEVKHLPGAHTLEFEEDPEPFYQVLVDALARGE